MAAAVMMGGGTWFVGHIRQVYITHEVDIVEVDK